MPGGGAAAVTASAADTATLALRVGTHSAADTATVAEAPATADEASATADKDIGVDSTDGAAAEGMVVEFQVTGADMATVGLGLDLGFRGPTGVPMEAITRRTATHITATHAPIMAILRITLLPITLLNSSLERRPFGRVYELWH